MTGTVNDLPTQRSQAKADRRNALLDAAATLFAEHGFNGVSLEDLGAAAGVSGPAVYRHFSGKQAVLGAILVGVSQNLLSGGETVIAASHTAADALRGLVQFHVDFALDNPDVIRVQDRDLASLTDADRIAVRTLQRMYVELWVRVLTRLHPETDASQLRIRAHAVFGLINSTPHSAHAPGSGAAQLSPELVGSILEQLALAALTAPA
ncbi:SACE_7040 family transcriptional regulator [Rathayibacter soli]|uniref:SACE_7040 family transcriptional regulator n=1 Tax=Rathayibacter soli TaxID=3144168 RepID=UPI0027E56E38|nr:TetR/AcrR family transcriptional regulator [Glaciibacter superstes]